MTGAKTGTLLLCLLLSGCGWFEMLDSDDSDRRRLQADVRDILEEIQATRARDDRKTIETMVSKAMTQQARPDERVGELAREVESLEAQVRAVEQRPTSDSSAVADEIYQVLERTTALNQVVANLRDEVTVNNGANSARFERLELRTSDVPWPQVGERHALHLASYKHHESALRGWEILAQRHAVVLEGMQPSLIEVETVAGRFIRLMVGESRSHSELLRMRARIRSAGDYAAILPIDGRNSAGGTAPAPGS